MPRPTGSLLFGAARAKPVCIQAIEVRSFGARSVQLAIIKFTSHSQHGPWRRRNRLKWDSFLSFASCRLLAWRKRTAALVSAHVPARLPHMTAQRPRRPGRRQSRMRHRRNRADGISFPARLLRCQPSLRSAPKSTRIRGSALRRGRSVDRRGFARWSVVPGLSGKCADGPGPDAGTPINIRRGARLEMPCGHVALASHRRSCERR